MIKEFDFENISQRGSGPVYPENRPAVPDELLPSVEPQLQEMESIPDQKYAGMPFEAMADMEIAQMVATRKNSSRVWTQSKRQTWDKLWDHYMQVYDASGKENWQSKIFQPDTVKVVEIITANLAAALLSPEMPIEWHCKIKEYEQLIRDTNDLVKNDITKSLTKVHLTDYIRSLCLLGTSIGKVGYELEEDIVMVKQRQKPNEAEEMIAKIMGQPLEVREDIYTPAKMLVKDWSKVENRDLYKIFPEPYTTEISKKHWLIEESKITNRELIELANHPDEMFRIRNVTPDLLSRSGDNTVNEDPDTQARRLALQQNSTSMHYYDPDMPHVLDEYWGPVPIWMIFPEKRNDEESKYSMVNGWVWVIDGHYVVRATLNPYRDGEPPYFKDSYIRIPGDWYGLGPAEMMIGLQIGKNEAVNTKNDNVMLMLNRVLALVKDKVPVDAWNRLKSDPGALWLFEQTDDIRKVLMPVEFPNLIKDIYIAINEYDRAIQEVTAAVKSTVGAGGGDDETGGGTFRGQLLNKQAASERFMLTARTMEFSGLSNCWRKIYDRIYQFKAYESARKIIGDVRYQNFEYILPEMIDEVANLVPLGVLTMESKGVRLAQMRDYVKLWQGRPWLKEYNIARREWVEMGQSDPDTATFSEEEMKQYNELKRQLMGPGMPGEGGPMPGGGPGEPASPIAGDNPPPMGGQPRPSQPAMGPGASPIDLMGRPAA